MKDLNAIGADATKVITGEQELTPEQIKGLFTISHVRAKLGAKSIIKNYDTLPKTAERYTHWHRLAIT